MSEQHYASGEGAALDDAHDVAKRRQTVRRAKIATAIVLVVLAVGAGRTVFSRIWNSRALEENTREHTAVYVKVASPKTSTAGQTLALPGTLQGFVQSPISARSSGYVRRWYKDIGSRVEKGELLAEIEAPEIDQQLSQAVAARQQAASGLGLAKSTSDRWEALRKKDAVSQQELDEKRSGDAQARANLAAADANVARLRELAHFKRIVAPFSGVITKRNVDVGDLIDAGGGAGRAMFVLAQTDPLRVYVNVPQTYAQLVKVGQKVNVSQAELAGRTFTGEVARTSGAIDPASRTMQVEITLPNKDAALMPGAYVQVLLPLQAGGGTTIPTNALIIAGDGVRVAAVDGEGRVHMRPVKIGRNYGETVEVLEGVDAKDQLVLNPSDSLVEGDRVAIAPSKPAAPDAKAKAKAKS